MVGEISTIIVIGDNNITTIKIEGRIFKIRETPTLICVILDNLGFNHGIKLHIGGKTVGRGRPNPQRYKPYNNRGGKRSKWTNNNGNNNNHQNGGGNNHQRVLEERQKPDVNVLCNQPNNMGIDGDNAGPNAPALNSNSVC